jgi:DNA-binding MarR family transcriptional regulator
MPLAALLEQSISRLMRPLPGWSAAMEMHQVRYFLAATAELNFTKAAEKCNVSQPSLTRAIKQLERELGGDLFRRERPQAQLTQLGEHIYPLLKQIFSARVLHIAKLPLRAGMPA